MKYSFSVFKTKVEDHVFWIAKSAILKGCVGQGETQEEAIIELEENEIAWLETAEECGIRIPEETITEEAVYSGKFMVRVSKSVHKKAAECAREEGVSLNQFVNDAIVEHTTNRKMMSQVIEAVKESLQEFHAEIWYTPEYRSAANGTYSNTINREAVAGLNIPTLYVEGVA